MRSIGISARLSDCKRRSDSRAIFVSSILGIIAELLAIDRRGAARFAAVAAGPTGELTFEVGFSEVNRKHLLSF